MHLAAANGDVAAVRSWLSAGGNVDLLHDESDTIEYPTEKGITPLMLAAKSGRLEVVELLVKAGAKLYRESYVPKRDANRNAFDYATQHNQPAVAKYLWSVSDQETYRKRAEINLRHVLERICAQYERAQARELAMFLIDNVASRQLATKNLWLISGQRDCLDDVRFLLERDVGFTPAGVTQAAQNGVTDLVALYLQRGADINARAEITLSPPGKTPLGAAAGAGQLEMVRYLLAHGADPNALDSYRRNALLAMVADGGCLPTLDPCPQHEIVRLLLRHGARSDLRDETNRTLSDYLALNLDGVRLRAILSQQ